MKRLLLLLLLVAMAVGTVYAQEQQYEYQRVAITRLPVFGVKGGVNISMITGPDAYDSSDNALGVHGGVLMQYNLIKMVYIQPELLYTQKGYNFQYSLLGVETKIADSYDYIELPVLLKLNLVVGDVQIQPYAGPTFSYLIVAKSKRTSSIGENSETHVDDMIGQMNRIDFGIGFGADVVLSDRVMLGARYNLGLSKIYKDSPLPGFGTDVKNGTFMVSAGYLFTK